MTAITAYRFRPQHHTARQTSRQTYIEKVKQRRIEQGGLIRYSEKEAVEDQKSPQKLPWPMTKLGLAFFEVNLVSIDQLSNRQLLSLTRATRVLHRAAFSSGFQADRHAAPRARDDSFVSIRRLVGNQITILRLQDGCVRDAESQRGK